MKRTLSYLTISLLVASGAIAAPLTPEEAIKRVQDDGILIEGFSTRSQSLPQLKKTLKAQNGEPALYLFDKGENNGFMVVSADDSTMPLLGYTDSGNLDINNLPPALNYWLEEYQNQIEFLRANDVSTRAEETRAGVTLPEWSAIAPLVKTQWNQDAPYNNLCPMEGNNRCYTGCVATSVAQAMKYFNYPEMGSNTVRYYCNSLGKTLSMKLGETTFDWDNMLDTYAGQYSEDQATAVATLMKAVGYAVQMQYTSQESGAISGLIPYALVEYFNYDKGISYNVRSHFNYSTWAQMIYDNLKMGPVVYDGQGSNGGHSWICDGYQGNGYFHMNWGWGGIADGYFLLDALSPESLGIGGGAGAYIFDQGAVLGMQPAREGQNPTQQSQVIMYGSLEGNLANGILTYNLIDNTSFLGWGYQGSKDVINFDLGAGIQKADNPNGEITYVANTNYYAKNIELHAYGLYPLEGKTGNSVVSTRPTFNLTNLNLEKGVKYKFYAAYKPTDGDWANAICDDGFYNYVYVTKTGDNFEVESLDPMIFTASNVSIESKLYYTQAVMAKATITNPNDTELSRYYALALVTPNKDIAFLGSDNLLTLPPKGSETVEWGTSLSRLQGVSAVTSPTEFYLGLYDSQMGILYYLSDNKVTMQPASGSTKISIDIEVLNAEKNNRFYIVKNAADFDVSTTVNVVKGYYADELFLGIYSIKAASTQATLVQSYPLGGFTFLDEGESDTWVTNIDFASGVIGLTYYLGVTNSSGAIADGTNSLSVGFTVQGNNQAGVESLFGPEGDILFLFDKVTSALNVLGGENGISSVEVYYLNGMKAPVKVEYNGDKAFVSLSELGKGVIVVTATDKSGKRQSTKIAL